MVILHELSIHGWIQQENGSKVFFLQEFCRDPRPFTYIDTHAGRGIYDVEGGRAVPQLS